MDDFVQWKFREKIIIKKRPSISLHEFFSAFSTPIYLPTKVKGIPWFLLFFPAFLTTKSLPSRYLQVTCGRFLLKLSYLQSDSFGCDAMCSWKQKTNIQASVNLHYILPVKMYRFEIKVPPHLNSWIWSSSADWYFKSADHGNSFTWAWKPPTILSGLWTFPQNLLLTRPMFTCFKMFVRELLKIGPKPSVVEVLGWGVAGRFAVFLQHILC